MDVFEAVRTRYSCRSYADRPVEEALLCRILDAARFAPTAKNLQRWRIVVAREQATRRKLMAAAKGQAFVGQAPVVLAFCSEGDNSHIMTCGQPSYPIDTAILQDHVSLLCTAAGLASCWVGAFDEKAAAAALGIPPEVRVVELMPLGYAADRMPAGRSRLPLEEIVHWDRW